MPQTDLDKFMQLMREFNASYRYITYNSQDEIYDVNGIGYAIVFEPDGNKVTGFPNRASVFYFTVDGEFYSIDLPL